MIATKSKPVATKFPTAVSTNDARYAIVERSHIATISPYARTPSAGRDLPANPFPGSAATTPSTRTSATLDHHPPGRHRLQEPPREQQRHRPAGLEGVRPRQVPARVGTQEHIRRHLEQGRPRQYAGHVTEHSWEQVQRQKHPGEE